MMNAHQCRERATAALGAAKKAGVAGASKAWRDIAHEWEIMATVVDLQQALMRPWIGGRVH